MQDVTPHYTPRQSQDTFYGTRRTTPRDQYLHRLPVAEAAELLGVTPSAVRKRVERGTLASDKEEDGRLFVYLDLTATDHDDRRTTPHDTPRPSHDAPRATPRDGSHDTSDGLTGDAVIRELRNHVADMQDQIRFLREELERKDAILLTLAQRVPELEPTKEEPTEPSGSSLTASEASADGSSRGQSPEEGQQKPSWWKRFLGTEG
jgi:hypothetical protein